MSDTKNKILDTAECLTQERGFSNFSYLDVAERVGIKAASIHYYFKSKDDLAAALVERTHIKHAKSFEEMNTAITSPMKRLEAVVEYFQGYVIQKRWCLCGMMAAELHSVSSRVSKLLNRYFDHFQDWIAQQFDGFSAKEARLRATQFLSALEGSVLLARLRNDPRVVKDALKFI